MPRQESQEVSRPHSEPPSHLSGSASQAGVNSNGYLSPSRYAEEFIVSPVRTLVRSIGGVLRLTSSPSPRENVIPPACPTCPGYARTQERAASLQRRVNSLENDLREAQALWDESRAKNVDLTKKLSAQSAKTMNLQKVMARAGRTDDGLMDADIQQRFVEFKSDIHHYVKDHINLESEQQWQPGVAAEMVEAQAKSAIATLLHDFFFSPNRLPFGIWDDLFDHSALHLLEAQLRMSGCDDALVREWRVVTVKAIRSLPPKIGILSNIVARSIWEYDLAPSIRHASGSSPWIAAQNDLWQLCNKTANLAMLFSASNMEYHWEQRTFPQDGAVNRSEHDVVLVEDGGQWPQNELDVSMIVFGGVVRGDKHTGLLSNGRARLSKSQVMARQRQ